MTEMVTRCGGSRSGTSVGTMDLKTETEAPIPCTAYGSGFSAVPVFAVATDPGFGPGSSKTNLLAESAP